MNRNIEQIMKLLSQSNTSQRVAHTYQGQGHITQCTYQGQLYATVTYHTVHKSNNRNE